ncbi:MAG: hypothetical protein KC491_01280 [Dehalococcoidia bacterium]|nr:hypothetical protein [Dehalococcoidia bacterium]
MKPIIGANHRAARMEIVLPVDASGEYAFDEAGKPIRGRTPLSFTVPRFDCMSRDQFKQLNKELADIDSRVDDDGEPLSPQERGIATVVAMVRPFVDSETLAVVEGLYLFELEQIAERIQDASKITLGELLASTSS